MSNSFCQFVHLSHYYAIIIPAYFKQGSGKVTSLFWTSLGFSKLLICEKLSNKLCWVRFSTLIVEKLSNKHCWKAFPQALSEVYTIYNLASGNQQSHLFIRFWQTNCLKIQKLKKASEIFSLYKFWKFFVFSAKLEVEFGLTFVIARNLIFFANHI